MPAIEISFKYRSNNVSANELEEIKQYRDYVYLINITLFTLLNVKESFSGFSLLVFGLGFFFWVKNMFKIE